MTDTTEYQGWTNRATWLVNLWLNNEQHVYDAAREAVRRAAEAGERIDDALEAFVSEITDTSEILDENFDGRGMVFELLSLALSQVNWSEVAESIGAD